MDRGSRRGFETHRPVRLSKERILPRRTPDGRYIVVRGRLWRTSNPHLAAERREELVKHLMDARRAVSAAKRRGDKSAEDAARTEVDAAKNALGERGPVWWQDGPPDFSRRMARNTTYAEWFASAAED